MKPITYPTRVVVPVDAEHGKILDAMAQSEIRTRPAVFLAALRLYFARVYDHGSRHCATPIRAGRGAGRAGR